KYVADTSYTGTSATVPYLAKDFNGANALAGHEGEWFTVGCEWTPEYLDYYYNQNDTVRRYTDNVMSGSVSGMCAMPMIIDVYMPALQYCIPFDTVYTVNPFNYDI